MRLEPHHCLKLSGQCCGNIEEGLMSDKYGLFKKNRSRIIKENDRKENIFV